MTLKATSSLKLYSAATPNGKKPTVYLSLLQQPYNLHKINFQTSEHKAPWYLKLNPNGAIPTLTDTDENGEVFSIMESSAILQYIGEKYDVERKFYYTAGAGRLYWEQQQWLTFTVATCAPNIAQAFKFSREDPPQKFATAKFVNETKKVLGILEDRVKENGGWLVGDHLNIADICVVYHVKFAVVINVSLDDFPHLKQWIKRIEDTPGVQEGTSVYAA